MSQGPGHKQQWCEVFLVRMRLAGWSEQVCASARVYLNAVRPVYSGLAWASYAKECERFLEVRDNRGLTTFTVYFPRRSGVGITLPTIIQHYSQKEPSS